MDSGTESRAELHLDLLEEDLCWGFNYNILKPKDTQPDVFSFFLGGGGRGVLLEAVEPPNTEFCVCTAYVCVLSEGGVLGG